MKSNQRRCAAGFTMVEVLLAMAVSGVVGIFLVAILVNNNGFFYKQSSLIEGGVSLNDATRKIEDIIRQSGGVVSGYPVASPLYTTGSDTLVVKLPAFNAVSTIDNIFDYAVIIPDSTIPSILRLKVFPDAQSTRLAQDLVLTTSLGAVQFKFLDKSGNSVNPTTAAVVGVDLTIKEKAGVLESNKTSSIIVTLRNN